MNSPIIPLRWRAAFTLVELLVVIAIIGILVALLLPTLQAVRETARQTRCVTMQKQISIALKTYEQANSRLPAGCFYQTTDAGRQYINEDYDTLQVGQSGTVGSQAEARAYSPFSFFVSLLPYLDGDHLYDRVNFDFAPFDDSDSNTDPLTGENYSNASLWNEPLPSAICPSYQGEILSGADGYSDLSEKPAITSFKAVGATNWATLCSSSLCQSPMISTTGQGGGILHPYGSSRVSGMAGTTMLLAETRERLYAAWADGTSSCVWGLSSEGETIINRDIQGQVSGGSGLTGMYSISSEHPDVVTISLYDGSVRTMSEDVEPAVLRSMITRDSSDNGTAATFLTAGN